MGVGHHQNFFRRTGLDEFLHDLAPQKPRVFDLGVKFSVRKGARTPFAKLGVALRVEVALPPKSPGVFGALSHRLAPLNHNGLEAQLGEDQGGKNTAGPKAHDHRAMNLRRSGCAGARQARLHKRQAQAGRTQVLHALLRVPRFLCLGNFPLDSHLGVPSHVGGQRQAWARQGGPGSTPVRQERGLRFGAVQGQVDDVDDGEPGTACVKAALVNDEVFEGSVFKVQGFEDEFAQSLGRLTVQVNARTVVLG